MHHRTLAFLLIMALGSCTRYAYYQSPFHSNSQTYRTIPLQSDSVKNSSFGSAVLYTGRSNDRQQDKVKMLSLSAYRTHSFKNFSAYYGFTGGPGIYHVARYTDSLNYSFDPKYINENSGNKFFAGLGLIGGANLVLPFERGGEFRFGVESAFNREFGAYYQFRKQMPDSSVNAVNRKNTDASIGFGFDLIGRSRANGSRFGWKQHFVWRLGKIPYTREPGSFFSNYFSTVFHYTVDKTSLYLQFNAGGETVSMQAGFNYRLQRTSSRN